jgi:hypothetical protein
LPARWRALNAGSAGDRISPQLEHRLFSAISVNWRGRPLVSHEVIVQLIAATTIRTGLTVHAELDHCAPPIGRAGPGAPHEDSASHAR